ncbi:MAG: hypothetical protein ABI652_07315, partial [Acidobacteriota bacterium]
PRMLRVRAMANEASAIASLRSLITAQDAYAKTCGAGAYAVAFATLGQPPEGATSGFLGVDLTAAPFPTKAGYGFTIAPGAGAADATADCNGNPASTAYYAKAVPQTFGLSGRRSFAVSATRAIWQTFSPTAPVEPFGPPAVPID